MSVLLFAGAIYYPSGGWDDLVGKFRSVSKARESIDSTRAVRVVPARVGDVDTSVTSWTGSLQTPHRSHRLAVGDRCGTGVVIAVNGDIATVSYPEETFVSYGYDWAQIVRRDRIVWTWGGDDDSWERVV